MEVIEEALDGVLLLKPRIFNDERGYFFESYNKHALEKVGVKLDFVQDNQSLSQKNVLRGLHFQVEPFAQGKLIRCITGAVLDVVVDIRRDSPHYGKYYKTIISAKNQHTLWIPPGFAHGFLTLEDNTIFSYKCTEFYNKNSERSILWNDNDINIDWEVNQPIISEKDKEGITLSEYTNQPYVSKIID